MNKYLIFVGIGFELIGLIIGSVFLGDYLETLLPTKGLWVAGLILASLVGWMVHLMFMLKSVQKSNSQSL